MLMLIALALQLHLEVAVQVRVQVPQVPLLSHTSPIASDKLPTQWRLWSGLGDQPEIFGVFCETHGMPVSLRETDAVLLIVVRAEQEPPVLGVVVRRLRHYIVSEVLGVVVRRPLSSLKPAQ